VISEFVSHSYIKNLQLLGNNKVRKIGLSPFDRYFRCLLDVCSKIPDVISGSIIIFRWRPHKYWATIDYFKTRNKLLITRSKQNDNVK
jgi:hypothetical protein